jgi:DNA-binding IclR family transcriptional regulator
MASKVVIIMMEKEHGPTSRVLDILEVLADSDKGCTLSELSELTGAAKSSIFPVLQTLSERRYIDKEAGRYNVGIASYAVGSAYIGHNDRFDLITGEMRHIVSECAETCQLGILDGNEVLYIGKVDGNEPIRMTSRVGKRLPASCTSLGKALMSDFDRHQLENLFPGGLSRLTDNSITDIDVLYEQILRIRETQIAYDIEETLQHLECIAVPLREKGTIISAISVTMPIFRSSPEKIRRIETLLLQAKNNIQSLLLE